MTILYRCNQNKKDCTKTGCLMKLCFLTKHKEYAKVYKAKIKGKWKEIKMSGWKQCKDL